MFDNFLDSTVKHQNIVHSLEITNFSLYTVSGGGNYAL